MAAVRASVAIRGFDPEATVHEDDPEATEPTEQGASDALGRVVRRVAQSRRHPVNSSGTALVRFKSADAGELPDAFQIAFQYDGADVAVRSLRQVRVQPRRRRV